MKKFSKVVALSLALALCFGLAACGSETTEATEATEAATEVTEEVTEDTEETTEDAEATTEASADEHPSAADADGNVDITVTNNDVNAQVTAKVVNGNWYVDDSYASSSGKFWMYNVPSRDEAYSNSPRIQVNLMDQEKIDYYADSKENVADIDSITIDGVEYKGTTYKQYGMEWTEYVAALEGTDQFIVIQISDIDIADGTEGYDVLTSIKVVKK